MFDFAEINYLAVLLATIATMIIGFLWYSSNQYFHVELSKA